MRTEEGIRKKKKKKSKKVQMMCVDLFARLQRCAKTCMSVKLVQKIAGKRGEGNKKVALPCVHIFVYVCVHARERGCSCVFVYR